LEGLFIYLYPISYISCCIHLAYSNFDFFFSVSSFVLTATMRKSYEVALVAVSQRWPVLLYGPVGAGKTALINKLARNRGNRGI
jgi:midasin (ATPase involved in ribosome maturation)